MMSADKNTPPAEDAQASLKTHDVGTLFAATYANMVNTEAKREHLYRLYGPDAELSHVTPERKMSAKTVNAIKEQLSQKKSLAANIEYTSISVQEGQGKCVVVLCSGIQTPVASKPRMFSQVFVLVPQPEGFYVNNDIFIVLPDVVVATPISAADEVVTNGTALEPVPAPAVTEVVVDEATPDVVPTETQETEEVETEEPAPIVLASQPDAAPAPAPEPVLAAAAAAVATPQAPVAAEVVTPVEAPAAAPPVRTEPMSYASLAAQPKSIRPPAPKQAKAPVAPVPAAAPATKDAPEESAGETAQATKPAQQRSQERRVTSSPQNPNQVFIRPVKQGTQDALSKAFSQFGQVEKVQLKDAGFGFVTFADAESVTKAIATGEVKFEDTRVTIDGMKPQKPGSAGRGRGRNVRPGRGSPMRSGIDRATDAQGGRRGKPKPAPATGN